MALRLDERGVVVTCGSCGRPNRITFDRLDATIRCAHCKTHLPPIASPAEVATVTQFDTLVAQAPVPVLVDFWAAWCGPCRMVAPEVEKVAARLAGRALALKVDTEALPELAARFRVQSIPTLAVFQRGELVERAAGAMPADSIAQLVERARAR